MSNTEYSENIETKWTSVDCIEEDDKQEFKSSAYSRIIDKFLVSKDQVWKRHFNSSYEAKLFTTNMRNYIYKFDEVKKAVKVAKRGDNVYLQKVVNENQSIGVKGQQ